VNRRAFLEAAGALLLPAGFRPLAADYEWHPHYREKTAIDDAVLRIHGEPLYDQLAPILNGWAQSLDSVQLALHPNFVGTSWQPVGTVSLRKPALGITAERLLFPAQPALSTEAFIASMRSAFPKTAAADLQIIDIQSNVTRVRYEFVLEREQCTGHWLLEWQGNQVVRWTIEDEVRCRAAAPLFSDITRTCFGIDAQLSHGADYWRTVLDGASGIDIYGHNGVSVGDIFGDGHDGVYICQAAGLPNKLFRNRGDGTFEDITESSGVGLLENTACALFADFSNRGKQDLLVVRASGPLLFVNQGNGKFALKPNAFHFAQQPQGTFTGASAADYNRDGFLDVYFCLYAFYQGTDQYKYPTPYFAAENGPPNFLMHNNGDGTFRDVTAQTGLNKNNTRYSFCCGWADYNDDGWPDLYVVNDFGKKNLYHNNGDGTFTDVAAALGVEDVGAGMSVSWFKDLYVANMWTAAGERLTGEKSFQEAAAPEIRKLYRKHTMGNSLFENKGGVFKDVTDRSQTGVGRWAWSSDAWDFDHDGFPDLYVTNGMISGPIREDLNSFFWREVVAKSPNTFQADADYEQGWKAINELIRSDYSWSGRERNVLFANNQDGTFTDLSGAAGLDFLEDGRSFVLVDFDGDGRQELLVKNRNAPQIRLMKNVAVELPPSITFRLRGTKSNRDAIGASITIGKQTKSLQAGSGFLSQHSKDLFFGLGDVAGNVSATVRWPGGLVQELRDLPVNHCVSVTEGEAATIVAYRPAVTKRSETQAAESLPTDVETWLLVPVVTPRPEKAGLVTLRTGAMASQPRGLEIIVDKPENEEIAAVYNLLFRSLFDRHRDMPLPVSFLVNERSEIVKVSQGHVDGERLAKALPFPGVASHYEFGRNYLSLGSIFFQRGFADYAESFFQSALKQDPTSAEAFYGLGSVYLKQGKNSLAQQNFESCVRLTPSYPETTPNGWNNLGLLATREGNTLKAIGYFERAIQVDPNHFIALENLGNAYKQEKRWDLARMNLEKALALKPRDAEANYGLGMVFAQTDDAGKAYEYLRRALDARPVYPEALNNLGILYLRTRRRDEAVASFQKCMEMAPEFEQAYLNLARVYVIEGDGGKAREVLKALLAKRPDSVLGKQALSQLP
jgi:tetratricopeptide (TPR) repeat protein